MRFNAGQFCKTYHTNNLLPLSIVKKASSYFTQLPYNTIPNQNVDDSLEHHW
jgi:hypothetical protein